MNLVQLANDLEFVPKEQLAQMSQDPNSRFPSYLVLSEIQRRTMNEKAYAAAQAPPTTTVAEEVVGEFMQPQGMQAGMPPESAPTDVFSSGMSGMPASAPMQQPMMMASGGSTSYFEGGPTDLTDQQYYSGGLRDFNDRLRNQSRIDAAQTSAQAAVTEGLDAAGQPVMSPQLVNQNLEPDEMEMEMGMASGGLTGYATGDRTSLDQSFVNPQQSRISKFGENIFELGSDVANWAMENPALAVSTGLMFIPGIGWGASAALRGAGLAYKGLKGIDYAKKAKQAGTFLKQAPIKSVTKPRVGTRVNTNQPLGEAAKSLGMTDDVLNMGRMYSPLRTTALGSGLTASALGYDYLTSPYSVESDNTDTDTELSQAEKDYNKRMQDMALANQEALNKQNALNQKKANRMFSPTDLIQLGGTVMGARDMSELGQGIAGVAGLSAQRKADEKQAGLQARYLQAQTGKLEAETAQLPERQILAEITGLTKQLSDLEESGGDDVQIQKIRDYLQYLSGELAKIRGYDPSMIAGNNQNVIASYT